MEKFLKKFLKFCEVTTADQQSKIEEKEKEKEKKRQKETRRMSVDLNNLTKVNMIIEEYSQLWREIQNMNFPAVNEKINRTISGLNLLNQDLKLEREANITELREEYDQFMSRILEDETLGDQDQITRYSRKIQENLLVIKAQLKQKPHNIPEVKKRINGIIILLGDLETRWYR